MTGSGSAGAPPLQPRPHSPSPLSSRTVPVAGYLSDVLARKLSSVPDDTERSKCALDEYIENVARYWFPSPRDVEAEVTDGPNDGGLDAYLVDKQSKTIVLFQCKWYASALKLSLKDSLDLHRFYTVYLKPGQSTGLSAEVRAFIVRFGTYYAGFRVRLIYLTTARLEPVAVQEYEKLNLSFELVDADRYGVQFEAVLSEQSEHHNEIVFSLVGDHYLEFLARFPEAMGGGSLDVPVIQCAIRGIDLKRAFRAAGEEAFSRNLRMELRGKINAELEETANSEKRFGFYVLHNGISLTCSDFRILALGTPPLGEGVPSDMRFVPEADAPFVQSMRAHGATVFVALKDFQIVNGAQTTFTLADLDDAPLMDVTIPCKISKTTDALLQSQIAACNNTQNAITPWDLAANSPELTLLQNYASRIESPIFVQRKRGEKWANVRFAGGTPPTPMRTLVAKSVYQDFLAFCGRPGAAYTRPGSAVAPGTPAYAQIQQARDIDSILLAGLVANYEDSIEQDPADPEFLAYWRLWAVALVGHIFRHHLSGSDQDRFKSSLLGENGPKHWGVLRAYLVDLMKGFLSSFPPGTDTQYVFKNGDEEWGSATFPSVPPRAIWPYVQTDVKEATFDGMRDKDDLAKGGIEYYEVNFAILAGYMDWVMKTKTLPWP
jgi:hypothetical protein